MDSERIAALTEAAVILILFAWTEDPEPVVAKLRGHTDRSEDDVLAELLALRMTAVYTACRTLKDAQARAYLWDDVKILHGILAGEYEGKDTGVWGKMIDRFLDGLREERADEYRRVMTLRVIAPTVADLEDRMVRYAQGVTEERGHRLEGFAREFCSLCGAEGARDAEEAALSDFQEIVAAAQRDLEKTLAS